MDTKIIHKELYDLLNQKSKLVEAGRALTKKIDDLETERNKVGLQIQKLKDVIIPLVESIMAKSLGEFEMITTVEVDKEKKHQIIINYIDQIEEYKKAIRERKNSNSETNQ